VKIFLKRISNSPRCNQALVAWSQTITPLGGVKDILVDVQVVGSTNRNLEAAVKEGRFREDLFYRLSVMPIVIAPLRERKEDIPYLVEHFIQRCNLQFRKAVKGITPEGMKLILNCSWPGNVRELKYAVERAMILVDGDTINVSQLPIRLSEPVSATPLTAGNGDQLIKLPPKGVGLDEIGKELIQQALEYAQGNKTKASKLLRISRDTLRYKVKKHPLE
jgi:two-component system, NtrC family, response regulator AtoC